ncbi:potassium channel family protein [Streptomyces sp. NPDC014882]|uniref:potassium channel family protein n=1 Tax=Streptomyces sp. NPDC014882 TaxID=3364927 RepID=UPI0036FA60A8
MTEVSRLVRWERRTEMLLSLASLTYLAGYAVLVLAPDLADAWRDASLAVVLASWALFVVDYAVRWRLSGQGPGFVRRHSLDTLVMVLPLLRPLRIVRLYEAVLRRRGEPRLSLHARVMLYAGVSTLLLGFAGALAVYAEERGVPGTEMHTFGDAVWWTCSTLATVGYGDVVPITPMGRLVGVGLMACGLALLGAVTGSFSSWLIQVFSREDEQEGEEEAGRPSNG